MSLSIEKDFSPDEDPQGILLRLIQAIYTFLATGADSYNVLSEENDVLWITFFSGNSVPIIWVLDPTQRRNLDYKYRIFPQKVILERETISDWWPNEIKLEELAFLLEETLNHITFLESDQEDDDVGTLN